jgi:hypothetical protein
MNIMYQVWFQHRKRDIQARFRQPIREVRVENHICLLCGQVSGWGKEKW